jgi:5-methylthioadenosine/S-adenosylhomocysteine deaminase
MTPSIETQLIRGRWVFTGEAILTDAAVAIQGDTIQAVDSWATLRQNYPQAKVLGSERFAVMPGLINAHHHSNGVPNSLQGIEDDFLEPWLFSLGSLRPQEARLQTLFSIAQLLRSGVTTVLDVASISGSPETCHTNLSHRLQAYEQAGMRVALAPGTNYKSFLVHGDGQDEAFLKSLPPNLARKTRQLVPLEAAALHPDDYLALIGDLVKTYQAHACIDVWFGPPGPQWVEDDLMVKIAAAAEMLDTGIQTHVTESFYEKLVGPQFYGKSVIAHLQELGVLSPRFSIAHGVWVTESDIEILAETGASLSHNPSSNLRLRAGIAPLNALLAGGATVGLGMDGTTIGDNEDMFAEMRLAARLHRNPQMSAPAPSWHDIFHIATQGSAKLLLQENAIGKLAPGFKADLVLVNCDRITWPWLAPEANPLQVVLMRANANDVDTVLVNGNVVLKGGQPTGFDLQAIGAALATQLAASPANQEFRDLAAAIRPHLTAWYANWPIPPLQPYRAFNSQI